MAYSYEHLHAEAVQQYALAHHHLSRLKDVLDQMASVRQGAAPSVIPSVRCVREWADYLASHGPTPKPQIHKDTGIKFTEAGGRYTVEWHSALEGVPEDHFAPNTIMKINADPEGKRGAPPKIYFLWSQRYDVRPLFGVGPSEPTDLGAAYYEKMTTPRELTETDQSVIRDLLDRTEPDVSGLTGRFDTMAEWDEHWAPTFDAIASAERKWTDEEKQAFRDTCPEGEDANAAVAIAHRAAVQRLANPEPLLGVVHPPEDPLTWPTEEDRRGWSQDPIPPAS